MPAYNSQSKRPLCDSQMLLCLYCFNLEANLFILGTGAIFFSPRHVWGDGSVKKPRHGCYDSLLVLIYFDFTFSCTLCCRGIFDVTIGNTTCAHGFRRCSLCVFARPWGAQQVSVRTAWLIWQHCCCPQVWFVGESVSDSTWIKAGLILGIVLVPFSVYFPTGKLISGAETSIWRASDVLDCPSCLLGGYFIDFQLANSVTGF